MDWVRGEDSGKDLYDSLTAEEGEPAVRVVSDEYTVYADVYAVDYSVEPMGEPDWEEDWEFAFDVPLQRHRGTRGWAANGNEYPHHTVRMRFSWVKDEPMSPSVKLEAHTEDGSEELGKYEVEKVELLE